MSQAQSFSIRHTTLNTAALVAVAGAALACGCSSSQEPSLAQTSAPAQQPAAATQRPESASAWANDPFAPPAAGGAFARNDSATPAATPFNLFGEVDQAITGDADRAGGANLTQVSFSVEGSDFDPDVSRDGRTLVFASTQHRATPDIYAKPIDGHVVTQLTNDPADDVMPKISPDGQRIAFASNRSGNWDIYVMPVSGGKAVQITSSPSDDLHPSWSPDGSRLVFCRLGEVSGQWEMWVTEAMNTGVSHFIGYGLFPEWSPVAGTGENGADRILFQKSRERGDRSFGVWAIDYRDGEAGRPTELASSPLAACINPSWSPDGKWVVFATVPAGGGPGNGPTSKPQFADLWMMDVNGAGRVHLTAGKSVNLMPVWSHQQKVVFVSDRGGVDNIWAMDIAGAVQLAAGRSSGPAFAAEPPRSSVSPAPMAIVPEEQ